MVYTDVIKISPKVKKELKRLKREWKLPSPNKVLECMMGILDE